MSANKNTTKNGGTDLAIWSSGLLNMLWIMNRFRPKGGVNMPMARLTAKTTPKCTKSIPSDSATGTITGARTRTAEDGSKKHPTSNKIIFRKI